MIWSIYLEEAVQEFHSETEMMKGALTKTLEDILSEDFEVKEMRFVNGLFQFKIKSNGLYEVEIDEIRYLGFECKSTRQYINSVVCTFIEKEE